MTHDWQGLICTRCERSIGQIVADARRVPPDTCPGRKKRWWER